MTSSRVRQPLSAGDALHELTGTRGESLDGECVEALVDNAVKYTPQGSHIHLRIDSEERDETTWFAVRVEDDGPGIPADRLIRIFESFVQGDGSVTREVGGMGLGLSLARSLAEKMQGRLDVTSEIGRGTTFTLLLPTG